MTSPRNSEPRAQAPLQQDVAVGSSSGPAFSARRRRLLRAGAIGAPAMLALASSPVMAANCKLPSGFSVSGNLSQGQKNCSVAGAKPSVWATRVGAGPNFYYNGTTLSSNAQFIDLLVGTGTGTVKFNVNATYTDKKLSACLALAPTDTNPQALIVATYLESIVSGGSNFPSQQQVLDMWNQGVIGAGYRPAAASSVIWNANDVLNYMKYLTGQVA